MLSLRLMGGLTAPVVLVMIVSRCTDTGNLPDAGGSALTACQTDAECAVNQACHMAAQKCLLRSDEAISFLAIPPAGNNQGWLAQEFVSSGGKALQTLLLDQNIAVRGRVYASDAPDKPISANLIAWTKSKVARRLTANISATTVTTKSSSDYLLWLPPGQSFDIFAAPKEPYDQIYPPSLFKDVMPSDGLLMDVVFEGEKRAVSVIGRVVDSNNQPLPFGVLVRAYQPDGWKRSTVATTCVDGTDSLGTACQVGEFLIRVPAGVAAYAIRVQADPHETAATAIIPTLECGQRLFGLVSREKNKSAGHDLGGPLMLPKFSSPARHRFKVVLEGTTDAVSGAQVRFYREFEVSASGGFDTCKSYFERTVTADANGFVEVILPHQNGEKDSSTRYTVTVVSPTDNLASTRTWTTFDVQHVSAITPTLSLRPRSAIIGRLRAPDGSAIAGASIDAYVPSTDKSATRSIAQTTTDAGGTFTLRVDDGTYAIVARPPESTGLAIAIAMNIVAPIVDAEDELVLVAPHAAVAIGQLKDPAQKSVAGWKIQAFGLADDSDPAAWVTRTIPLSEGIVDSTGKFSIIVPTRAMQDR